MVLPLIAALIPALAPIVSDVFKRVIPDPEAAKKAETELTVAILEKQHELQNAAASIIQAEAKSDFWIVAAWRPILMLVFGGLIVSRWFGFAGGISEEESLKLWSIVEGAIQGYIIGRSAEKVVPAALAAFKK